MFKSIKWKIVIMFVLVLVSVIILVGTFFRITMTNYYLQDFTETVTNVFSSEFSQQLEAAVSDPSGPQTLFDLVDIYSDRLGLDRFRFAYVLNSKSDVVYSTDINTTNIEKTPNIIAAMNGKVGSEISSKNPYMDYAYPVISDGQLQYIIYVWDSKEELGDVIRNLIAIIMQSLLFGLIISVVLGYFMARNITQPIIVLTKKSEQLAEGNFETRLDIESNDEIGTLASTFTQMAEELKQTLSTIDSEKNKLETILQFMSDGVMFFDRDGCIIHINHAALKLFGISDPSSINFNTYFKQFQCDITLQELVFKENETVHRQIELDQIVLDAFFGTTTDEDNKLSGILAVFHDITQQQKLDESRKEFVANVSHELRTPLTTVKTYTETLMESDALPVETARNFLSVISAEADRMTRLVHDLLVLSQLDSDKADVAKEPFHLNHLLEDIMTKLSISARERNQSLKLIQNALVPDFYGNRDRIEQLITNIVGNAIKYTPEGGKIRISLDCLFDDNSVCIKIKDNGVGIPEKDIPHIFERFYRVDKARSRESGGTGLGLAIAKQIVLAHGGSITLSSKQGEGTEFTVVLPRNQNVI